MLKAYSYVNTLGAAYYRLGEYDKAREALSRATELRKQGPTASNRFFLAMSHHRLGDPAKARACYDQALAWWKAQAKLTESLAEQLSALRAEADALFKGR